MLKVLMTFESFCHLMMNLSMRASESESVGGLSFNETEVPPEPHRILVRSSIGCRCHKDSF